MQSAYKFNLNNKGTKNIGFLVPLDFENGIRFEVKRIFYTYNVPEATNRGSHAYYNTEQVLICVAGRLSIKCFDGKKEEIYILDKPNEGLYINPKVWRTTFDHSPDAVLLALSSLEYNEDDYIRDYDEYMEVI